MSGWRESENMCPDFLEETLHLQRKRQYNTRSTSTSKANVLYHDLRLMKMYFTPLVPISSISDIIMFVYIILYAKIIIVKYEPNWIIYWVLTKNSV
jgi:uncharacterized membrane protein (DUF106 family)